MTFGQLRHAARHENAVHARLAACASGLLGGCAKATIGKVQEVEAGTYSIGISRASGIATDMNKALSTAVDKAGEFCHAKGQKFMLKSAVGSSVVFRCVSTAPSPE
jgi:hypothetical protein